MHISLLFFYYFFSFNVLISVFFYFIELWTHTESGNWVSISLGNNGFCWTVFARNRDTAVPAEGNGDLRTLICVLVARSRRCSTLSNPVPWQNWMAAYLGYTLRMKTLFRGWPVMVHDTHTRRRRLKRDKYGFAAGSTCLLGDSRSRKDVTLR